MSEFWTKLFLQFWSFVMKISKVQFIWTMSSAIFKWTDFFQKRSLHMVLNKLRRAWTILKNAKSLNIIILANHLWPKTSTEHNGACTLRLLAHQYIEWHTLKNHVVLVLIIDIAGWKYSACVYQKSKIVGDPLRGSLLNRRNFTTSPWAPSEIKPEVT